MAIRERICWEYTDFKEGFGDGCGTACCTRNLYDWLVPLQGQGRTFLEIRPAWGDLSADHPKGGELIGQALLIAVLVAAPAGAASPIEGQWINPSRSLTVRVAPCDNGRLCGRVIRASSSAKAKAAAAGTPRLIGTELMRGLEPTGDGTWRGTFFVPDRNVRAEGNLRLLNARTIELQGCAMGGLLCKSQRWSRIGAPMKVRTRH